MKPTKKHEETILSVVLWLTLILACVGLLSPALWYVKHRQVVKLQSRLDAQTVAMQSLAEEIKDKRFTINEANKMLSMAYPKAGRPFFEVD